MAKKGLDIVGRVGGSSITQNFKKAGKRVLLATGLCLLLGNLGGCVTPEIPLKKVYDEIKYDRPYILNVYDCSDKSMDYFNELAKNGYDVKYHSGYIEQEIPMTFDIDGRKYTFGSGEFKRKSHAWLTYIDEDGVERLLEPTIRSVQSGFPVEHYSNYKSHSIEYESHPESKIPSSDKEK